MQTTEELLQDRGRQYGSFKKQVVAIANIMNNLRDIRNQDKDRVSAFINKDIENMFLVLKLVRLQTANDIDSIDDLIGYATLIKRNMIQREKYYAHTKKSKDNVQKEDKEANERHEHREEFRG